jgi:hypothetical protein
MNRKTELEHLRQADAHIAAARDRVERQTVLVARLMECGHETTAAKSVLETMRDTLVVMQEQRRIIKKELEG